MDVPITPPASGFVNGVGVEVCRPVFYSSFAGIVPLTEVILWGKPQAAIFFKFADIYFWRYPRRTFYVDSLRMSVSKAPSTIEFRGCHVIDGEKTASVVVGAWIPLGCSLKGMELRLSMSLRLLLGYAVLFFILISIILCASVRRFQYLLDCAIDRSESLGKT